MKNSLSFFIKNRNYSILLSSWTPPIYDKLKIDEILSESEMYIKKLDKTVKSIYTDKENLPLENCRKVIEKLNLPKFYINSIVDNAFKGHLL